MDWSNIFFMGLSNISDSWFFIPTLPQVCLFIYFYTEHNNYLSLVFMLCNLHNNFVQYSHYIIYTILLLFFFGMENIINAFGRGL